MKYFSLVVFLSGVVLGQQTGGFEIVIQRGHVPLSWDGRNEVFATGGSDQLVKLWTKDGRLIRTLSGHRAEVTQVAMSPDGQLLVSGGDYYDGSVRLIHVPTGTLLTSMFFGGGSVDHLAFSPNGRYLFMEHQTKTKVWRIDGVGLSARLVEIKRADWPPTEQIPSVKTENQYASKKSTVVLPFNPETLARDYRAVAVRPDGEAFATVQREDSTARITLWSVTGALIKSWKTPYFVSQVHFSSDGGLLVFTYENLGRSADDHSLILLPVDGDLTAARRLALSQRATSIAVGPTGKIAAAVLPPAGRSSAQIHLWDAAGNAVQAFDAHKGLISALAFHPEGSWLLSAGQDAQLRLWDIEGKTIWETQVSEFPEHLSFSPDGREILYGGWSYLATFALDGRLLRVYYQHRIEAAKQWAMGESPVSNGGYSPDGKHVYLSSFDGTRIFSRDGSLVIFLKGGRGPSFYARSGTHFITLSDEDMNPWSGLGSSVRLWNLRTLEFLTVLNDGDEWIAYTRDGLFDASPNGGRLVGVTRGLTVYGIDQFAVRNNRPDLMLRRLELADSMLVDHYYAQYLRRLRKLGITEAQVSVSTDIPEVTILDKKRDGRRMVISVRYSDKRSGLRSANIFINDVPLFAEGRPINGLEITKSDTLLLNEGRNKIEVSCTNANGTESYRVLLYEDVTEAVRPDLYYVGFGVSKYERKDLTLKYAHKDALDLAAAFKKMKDSFGAVHASTFTDEQVTPENIRKAKSLLASARPEDVLVLFIAGHGMYSQGADATYYYLTYAADPDNLLTTAADFTLIEDLLHGIAPRKKFFLMDTCESGEIEESAQEAYHAMAEKKGVKARSIRGMKKSTKGGNRRSFLYQRDRFIYSDVARRSGAIVFSSSKGGQFSYEDDRIKNGFFTSQILQCLKDPAADGDGDGRISSDEIRRYVSASVPKLTDGKQQPVVDRDNLSEKILLPMLNK